MPDAPIVHIGENSPQHVAYQLFRHIAAVEGKSFNAGKSEAANRKWILDTYAECLRTVLDPQHTQSTA
jgi:hypothetical protein